MTSFKVCTIGQIEIKTPFEIKHLDQFKLSVNQNIFPFLGLYVPLSNIDNTMDPLGREKFHSLTSKKCCRTYRYAECVPCTESAKVA